MLINPNTEKRDGKMRMVLFGGRGSKIGGNFHFLRMNVAAYQCGNTIKCLNHQHLVTKES